MEEHSLDEFLDDPRFITEEQKQIYLTKGKYLSTRSKTAIAKNFEDVYENFKWCGTRKGITYIKLGDVREKPRISHDKRHTRQTTESALIIRQAIFNFMNKLDPEDKNIHDGYYYTTSLPFLFKLGLAPSSLESFYENYYHEDEWDEDDLKEVFTKEKFLVKNEFYEIVEERLKEKCEEKKLIQKQYLDAKKKIWRELLGQAGNLPDMKENYICEKYAMNHYFTTEPDLDGNVQKIYSSVLMTEEQEEKYKSWVQEMEKRDDVEKPKIYKKKNEKMERWEQLEKDFIDREFNATLVYTKIGLKINGSYGESKDIDLDYFREDYKFRTSKLIATTIINTYKNKIIWNIEHSKEMISQDFIAQLEVEFKTDIQVKIDSDLDVFDALDLKNGLGARNKDTQEYIDMKKNEIKEMIHKMQQELDCKNNYTDADLEELFV